MKENVPFGYEFRDGKLVVNTDAAESIKYFYEAIQTYTENPPVWNNAVINDNYVCFDTEKLCGLNTFIKGYIAAEVNLVKGLGKSTEALLNDEQVRFLVRQKITSESIDDFCSRVKANILLGF